MSLLSASSRRAPVACKARKSARAHCRRTFESRTSFSEDLLAGLAAEEILPLDRQTMAQNVELWDVRKQRHALREFAYYLERVERHSPLSDRFREFVEERGLPFA